MIFARDLFDGTKVLVTGAGQGIGLEVCRQFAQCGATVGLNDLDVQRADRAAQELSRGLGQTRVHPCVFDIANVAATREGIGRFAEQQGGLDVLVANAGITNYGPFLSYGEQDLDRLLAVNLRGTYFTCQAAAQQMAARRTRGRILLISSVCGITAHMNLSAYGMTKAAISHLARCLALELGPLGILVNVVAPGAILTERTLQDDPDYEKNWRSVTPNRRAGSVGDVAQLVLFLASPAARHIHGEAIILDGGWTTYGQLPPAYQAAQDPPEGPSDKEDCRAVQ